MADFNPDRVIPSNLPGSNFESTAVTNSITPNQVVDLFCQFILEYKTGMGQLLYRDMLQSNIGKGEYCLEVDLEHLFFWSKSFSPSYDLRHNLISLPLRLLPLFEQAASRALALSAPLNNNNNNPYGDASESTSFDTPIQIILQNLPQVTKISELQGNLINRLVSLSGIIVTAMKPQLKAVELKLKCRNCGYITTQKATSMSSYATTPIPQKCGRQVSNGSAVSSGTTLGGSSDVPSCPTNPYEIIADECHYIDVQQLKLQDLPEEIPSGEMPRNVKLSCNRSLVDRLHPGNRVRCIGIYTTTPGRSGASSAKRDGGNAVEFHVPYLYILGYEIDTEATNIQQGSVSAEEEQELQNFVRSEPNIYEKIARSIAPAIMQNEDVKKAIACCLFGGTRKSLNDGMNLRGDINVLLLGDPSVAKSQFLKFASEAAPISVYTSGKGSSAAGLTAAVVRSAATGDFHLEAGALVLASGGIVCIDEFDKMREQDRVAIHEAMEQQTISIAKAGITTILNSRTSVLAAANPVFGRYDDMKSATDNIDFQATILSRFDLIFILRDLQLYHKDVSLAKHMIEVHQYGKQQSHLENNDGTINQDNDYIPLDMLKRLIAYARNNIHPVLGPDARERLASAYVKFRNKRSTQFGDDDEMVNMAQQQQQQQQQVIPITVRQLEAIIRISESIARMNLASVTTAEHVEEALRLFKAATLKSAQGGSGLATNDNEETVIDTVKLQRLCQDIMNFVPAQVSTKTEQIRNYFHNQQYSDAEIRYVLDRLVAAKKLQWQRKQQYVYRSEQTSSSVQIW